MGYEDLRPRMVAIWANESFQVSTSPSYCTKREGVLPQGRGAAPAVLDQLLASPIGPGDGRGGEARSADGQSIPRPNRSDRSRLTSATCGTSSSQRFGKRVKMFSP